MRQILFIVLVITCLACSKTNSEKAKAEILQTEKEFEQYAKEHSIHEAFVKYAADSAVILRSNKIHKGKAQIQSFYDTPHFKNVVITWKPDFVEVSSSGDMGYTYGHFTHSTIDSNGKVSEFKGIFHTVWERQSDGNWRFVWD